MKSKKIGKYELIQSKQLGKGTLGKSYIGFDPTGIEVTIKVIPKQKQHQVHHLKEAFKSEVKYLSKIINEHIAEYLDVVETANNFYIVREFCTAGSLKELLGKKGPLPQKEVLTLLVSILRAFHPLITKGVIHKNLTPNNLLFANGVLKLADFGQTKMSETLSEDNTEKSEQFSFYQSPEVLDGVKGNFECDIWSLGIILFECLYGECPWGESTNKKDFITEIKKTKLEFPEKPTVSKSMQKFIMSCLMLDINDRAEWTEIFESSLLKEFELPKLDDVNEKFCLILKTLKDCIEKENIDVERYFQGKELVENNSVNRKKFITLVKPIAPDITDDEIDFIYVRLDKNGDEQLQIRQFEDALIEFDIQLQGIYRRKAEKLLKANECMDEEEKKDAELTKIYQGLIENLEKKQVFDLYELYTESDTQMIGNLDFDSFVKLLRKIDQTLIKRECQMVFEAFDTNGDQKISFNEFFNKMCQITGSPNGLPKC